MPVNHVSTETHPSPANKLFEYDPLECYLPACQHKDIRLCGHAVLKPGLTLIVEIQSPPGVPCILYPLGSYEMVAEFKRMLSYPFKVYPGEDWDGQYFYAFLEREGARIYWRERSHGITICVTAGQWGHLKEAFAKAFALPEYSRVWIRLTAERGGE